MLTSNEFSYILITEQMFLKSEGELIMTKKIYLKSPVKLIRSILILLGVVIVTMFVAMSPSYSKLTPQYELVTGAQGDTLWSISSQYAGEDEDIRDYIDEIKEINNLNKSSIKEGQQIKVRVS